MIERKYKFRYMGITPDKAETPLRKTEGDITIIDLYRRKSETGTGIWWIEIDFPLPIQTLEQTRPCSSFLDLVEIMEESDALERFSSGSRKTGDDVLIFRRQLRLGSRQQPEICSEDRVLVYKPWDYNFMRVLMKSRNPIPYYDCARCGDSDEVVAYSEMIGSAISYIGGRASSYIGRNLEYTGHLRYFFPEDLDKMFELPITS